MTSPILQELHRLGHLDALDFGFARLLERRFAYSSPPPDSLVLAAALLVAATRQGHTSLDFTQSPRELVTLVQDPGKPLPEELLSSLSKDWKLPDRWLPILGNPGELAPLIRDGSRLYLQRYHLAERGIAAEVVRRATRTAAELTDEQCAAIAEQWSQPHEADQAQAVQRILRHNLTIISGGPGTGKTHTVLRALSLLPPREGRPWRVVLAAPTGKAVARLQELVPSKLPDTVRAHFATLHRLLQRRPAEGRHDQGSGLPWPYDIAVVDEMSMVDAELMYDLVTAWTPETRVVLLGDRHQLASVQPGNVFAGLCSGVLDAGPPVSDVLVELRHNFRFDPRSGIGRLAEAIVRGQDQEVVDLLRAGAPDVTWQPLPRVEELTTRLWRKLRVAWRTLFESSSPSEALRALRSFRILSAHRSGPWGCERIHKEFAQQLGGTAVLHAPLVIVQNAPDRGLYNGDGGLWWRDGERWIAHIETAQGVRTLPESRLPPHEPAWVLTVHKSQGSEFDEVLLVLPQTVTPILTRELLYTAVTRARQRLEIWAPLEVVRAAVRQPTRRFSGLSDLIPRLYSSEARPAF